MIIPGAEEEWRYPTFCRNEMMVALFVSASNETAAALVISFHVITVSSFGGFSSLASTIICCDLRWNHDLG